MSIPPNVNPYAVLGISRDATFQDIKRAHRKRILKCHPDKVQGEAQRAKAQDEFQAVQQSYELLSDETERAKYDRRVRIGELRQELREQDLTADAAYPSTPTAAARSANREFRDGRIYEERVPANTAFFDDEDVPSYEEPVDDYFADEPWSHSRKYDDGGRRMRAKYGSADKKSRDGGGGGGSSMRYPFSASKFFDSAKKSTSDSNRASHDKARAKELRREVSEKHRRTVYVQSDDDDDSGSDYSILDDVIRAMRPSDSSRKNYHHHHPAESSPARRSKTDAKRETRYYDDEGYDKHDRLHDTASSYIRQSKGPERRSPSRHRRGDRSYGSAEPEIPSRCSGRSTRSRDRAMHAKSDEHLDWDLKDGGPPLPRETVREMSFASSYPKMRRHSTYTSSYSFSRPAIPRASTTSTYNRAAKTDRDDDPDSLLYKMAHETTPSRPSKLRTNIERQESRPSPSIPTPSKSSSTRRTREHEVLVDPDRISPPRRQRTWHSPSRSEHPLPSRPKPNRSSTFSDPHTRIDSSRLKSTSRSYFDYPRVNESYRRHTHDYPIRMKGTAAH